MIVLIDSLIVRITIWTWLQLVIPITMIKVTMPYLLHLQIGFNSIPLSALVPIIGLLALPPILQQNRFSIFCLRRSHQRLLQTDVDSMEAKIGLKGCFCFFPQTRRSNGGHQGRLDYCTFGVSLFQTRPSAIAHPPPQVFCLPFVFQRNLMESILGKFCIIPSHKLFRARLPWHLPVRHTWGKHTQPLLYNLFCMF